MRTDIVQHDPFRSPDQRWLRARYLLETGRLGGKKEDPYVLVARKLMTALDNATNEFKHDRLASRMPGAYHAHAIWQRTDQDDRWVLEARVLADEDRQSIAHKMGTSPEVVFWYEQLFFDVRAYLDQRDWLVNRVLGPSVHRGVTAREFDVLLKIYALVGGPVVVDALAGLTSGLVKKPTGPEELDVFWAADSRDVLRQKAALAARTLPVTRGTQTLIVEAHHRLLDIERQAGEGRADDSVYLKNIAAALKLLPFTVGKHAAEDKPAALAHFDRGALELRTHEVLSLTENGVAPNLDALEGFTIPEVPERETHQ